ncbi:MAG: hypothetical protein ACJAS1_004593 [Oleiphilaceae bacterium]|jgi:uncharacterized protein YggE
MRQVLIFFLLISTSIFTQASEQPLININAEGKVKIHPDMAVFNLTVQTTELDANKAHRKIDSQVKELLKRIKKFDVKESSLDSSQTSIQAEYDYSIKPKRLLGYKASRQVSFNLIELKQLDSIVADLSKLDYTNLNNIQFSVQETQYYEDLALINAIQIAKQKAELIANEFGVELGRLNKISHQVKQNSSPVFARAMSMEMAKTSSYEQKDIEMNAFIEVSFLIK